MPSIVDYIAGYTNQGEMRDYQHASRLYVDNIFALAPKAGWLYYVVFSIEPSAISEALWKGQRRDYEAGMLVKSCDLPKFSIATETLNQYNRKTNVQTKITYNPINFTFHDDQSNVTNSLWVNYFRYYYRDTWWGQRVGSSSTEIGSNPAGYKNTKYSPATSLNSPDGRDGIPGSYGLNNNQSKPFFKAITIYQLNQKRFTSYVIVNPLITAWNHDSMDQTQTKTNQNSMTIAYETVFYGEGKVRRDQPSGFATFHYDVTPSPLSISGGGTNTLFGPGGVISGIEDIFGTTDRLLGTTSGTPNPFALVGLGIQGSNLIKNARNITRASLQAEGKSILNSALSAAVGGAGGGLSGFIGAGLGSLGGSLGFGPRTGTLLVGSNFKANNATASAGDVVGGAAAGTSGNAYDAQGAAENLVNTTLYSSEDIKKLTVDDYPDAISSMESNAKQLQAQLDKSSAMKEEVDSAINSALARSGPAEANQIRAQYASQGYQDPATIQANLDANLANQKLLTTNYDKAKASQ